VCACVCVFCVCVMYTCTNVKPVDGRYATASKVNKSALFSTQTMRATMLHLPINIYHVAVAS